AAGRFPDRHRRRRGRPRLRRGGGRREGAVPFPAHAGGRRGIKDEGIDPAVTQGNAVLEKSQPQRFNAYNSPHEDLREFIKRAEEAGEIVRIKGADWKLEMGTLGEIVNHMRPEPPALLFEDVPGYPKGMRLISGATNSSKPLAI